MARTCAAAGCTNPAETKGLCGMHFQGQLEIDKASEPHKTRGGGEPIEPKKRGRRPGRKSKDMITASVLPDMRILEEAILAAENISSDWNLPADKKARLVSELYRLRQ
ncbi:MAG: hypothetical protein HY889_10325 [Deltaproteobacteria bacterium]|nr:hypothetical protein [Deltaproteobacteria bacterium]